MKKYIPFLVVMCFILLYLGSIWQRPLYISDETRYAEISREMLASGDFIVPQLNGLLYFEKPVLGYWMNAVAQSVFGETAGSVRFMGALCTLLTALLIWLLCRRAREENTGRVAAAVYLLSGLVFAVGTYGVLDAHFCFFVMLTMTAFYYAYTEKTFRKRAGFLALSGLGAGLAFLSKGGLGFILPAIAIVPFLLWQKEWKRLFTFLWIPLFVAVLVVLPWSIAVHRAVPDFWHQFIMVEHVQRFLTGEGSNDYRGRSFWFFIPVLLGSLLPWILFLPVVWLGYRGRVRELFQTSLLRYVVCMGAVWFVLFTISCGKLATYILPCFPAYAILLAVGLVRYAENSKDLRVADWVLKTWFRILLPALLVFFALQAFNLFFPEKISKSILLFRRGENFASPAIMLMLMLVWLWMAQETRKPALKFAFFCAGVGCIAFTYSVFIPPHRTLRLAPVSFLEEAATKQPPNTLVLADDRMLSAAAWAFRRADIGVYYKKGELAYGLKQPGAEGRFCAQNELSALIRKEKRPISVVVCSRRRVKQMPVPSFTYSNGEIYLLHYGYGLEGEK